MCTNTPRTTQLFSCHEHVAVNLCWFHIVLKNIRKDRYNPDLKKYYVVYEEAEEELSEDEERRTQQDTEVPSMQSVAEPKYPLSHLLSLRLARTMWPFADLTWPGPSLMGRVRILRKRRKPHRSTVPRRSNTSI